MLEPLPPEVEQLIERRRQLGLDLYDEIWEGTYHVAPAPMDRHGDLDQQLAVLLDPLARDAGLVARGAINVGEQGNFRVPDRSLLRERPDPGAVYHPSAAVVIEILSPGDETWDKLPFYASRAVEELWVVDPEQRRVHLLRRTGDGYEGAETSGVLDTDRERLEAAIRWPVR